MVTLLVSWSHSQVTSQVCQVSIGAYKKLYQPNFSEGSHTNMPKVWQHNAVSHSPSQGTMVTVVT